MNKEYNLKFYDLEEGKKYESLIYNGIVHIGEWNELLNESGANVWLRQDERFRLVEEKPTHLWRAYYAIEDQYPVYVSYYIDKADFDTEHRKIHNSDPLHTLLSWERIELEGADE